MIKIKNLTVKNFMSVGNATQAVDFDRNDLTLVLGENLDLGGDGARNGVGKTSIINALSYAMYGQALSNIRLNNLINKTNAKNMLVSIDFDIDTVNYRIERGRKPNLLKFYIEDEEQHDDEQRGEMRDTQKEINGLLNISHDMFKHTIALNTYTEPFLSMRAHDQKNIIEQLLGITLLTEKADKLKIIHKETKNLITEEEYRIEAVTKANEHIKDQISKLEMRQRMWIKKKDENIANITAAIEESMDLNISNELQLHKDLENWKLLDTEIKQLNKYIKSIVKENKTLDRAVGVLEQDIKMLENHKCHSCGQDLHDEKQAENIKIKQDLAQEKVLQFLANESQENEHKMRLVEIGDIGDEPELFYEIFEDALQHQHTLNTLTKDLETALASADPYTEQVEEMKADGLVEVNYDEVNRLTNIQEHQAFLYKLLTSKDSFIRRKIIEQNLNYLNNRLTHYLGEIGLPHRVVFLSDLSVEISEMGRDLDFDNLSRGERSRLILSLSFAFRDVWESLYSHINLMFVDELIDNGLDTNGVESAVKILKGMARERNKSVWLVSHREELTSRVHNTLMVRKQGGFSSYEGSVE